MALNRGLLGQTGKTPEATMASALYTDVKRKEGSSAFIRPVEGMFGLREWADMAFDKQYRYVVLEGHALCCIYVYLHIHLHTHPFDTV